MSIEYSIVPIERWPETWDRNRPPTRKSPFSASWSQTLDTLVKELEYLRAEEFTIQVDLTRDDFRLDGNLRTAARINYPGVILGFNTKQFGGLSYPCNTFAGSWKENVRAIALGLEALRRVERYGIAERGQQYAGFKELGSGTAMSSMTKQRALEILLEAADVDPEIYADDDSWRDGELFQRAAKTHHPDVGGDVEYFKLLVEARDKLEAS